jgi:hypothetical protein
MESVNQKVNVVVNGMKFDASLDRIRSWRAEHIYFDLEKLATDSLPITAQMEMYYFFRQIERCLLLYRRRHLHQAELFFTYLAQSVIPKDTQVSCGMYSLRLAMEAYRDFVLDNGTGAQEKLEQAIDYALRQSVTVPRFLIAAEEQWFNKIKAFAKTSSFNEGVFVNDALLLLCFGYTGIADTADLSAVMEKNQSEDKENMIINNLDRLLKMMHTLMSEGKFKTIWKTLFFKQLQQIVVMVDKEFTYGISSIINLIGDFFQGNKMSFLDAVCTNMDIVNVMPFYIKREIVQAFLTTVDEYKVDISHCAGYGVFATLIKQYLHIRHIPLMNTPLLHVA